MKSDHADSIFWIVFFLATVAWFGFIGVAFVHFAFKYW